MTRDSTLWTRWNLLGDDTALRLARANLGEHAFAASWRSREVLSLEAALDEAFTFATKRGPDR